MDNEINEAIEVATFFKGGKAQPLAFRWQQNVFKIAKVNLCHQEKIGKDLIYIFSVSSENDDTYKISFNANELTWKLEEVCL